jgi:hypothetical protein
LPKDFRRREAVVERGLKRLVTIGVNVEAGHVGDGEWTEKWQAEPGRRPDDCIDVREGRDSLFHTLCRFAEEGELQAV